MVDLMVAAKKKKKSMKEENLDEAMTGYEKARKAAAKRAADRNALRKAGKMGGRMENETYRNEAGTRMHHKGSKVEEVELDEKCWKGYEKKGMKTMFGKRYPNCVKKKVGESMVNWRDEIGYEGKDDVKKLSEDDMKGMSVKSGHKRPTKSGAGMTAKGVAAYRRRNPGSKLKTAVTTEPSKLKKGSKSANRRKSYCARSAGQMKKFPKAAKDPDSRLRQARRRWNC